MDFEDVKTLYERYKKEYGKQTYKKISQILTESKEIHKRDFLKIKPN